MEGEYYRIAKVASEFGVGVMTISEVLGKFGYEIEPKPTSKISSVMYNLLKSIFRAKLSADDVIDAYMQGVEQGKRVKIEDVLVLPIPENLKDLFIDSLRAFENYSKLTGYEVKFSFDNAEKDRLGFKFTVTENPNNLSNDEIRADIKEFLEKIQRGEEIKDIPILINEVEHYKVLTILNNKLSTLRHNAYLESNLNSGIEQIIEKVIEKKGFSQSIHIYNQQENMSNSKQIDAVNSNINMGDGNFIEDKSINIEHSFNEKKTIVEKIEYSIQQIDNEEELSAQDKQDLRRHLENIKEEITDEAQPDASKLKKSWEKIKKIAEGAVFSYDLTQALQWISEQFGFAIDFSK